MIKIKKYIIHKFFGGENIEYYKKSLQHPLIGKKFFNIDYGFCTVTQIWNIKERSTCTSGHNYEKDDRIIWHWKVKVKTNTGYYLLRLCDFISRSANYDGSKIDDRNLYMFYK